MASRDKHDLHEILTAAFNKAVDIYKEKYPVFPQPFLTCTYRSPDEQNILFTQTPKVTNAKGGESPHNFLPSLAFDVAFIGVDKKLDWSAELFTNFNNILKDIEPKIEWGGGWKKFSDSPHFQIRNWKNYLSVDKNIA